MMEYRGVRGTKGFDRAKSKLLTKSRGNRDLEIFTLVPSDLHVTWKHGVPVLEDQEFYAYGQETTDPTERQLVVALHARGRDWAKERNWPDEHWQRLILALLDRDIPCIIVGHPDYSRHFSESGIPVDQCTDLSVAIEVLASSSLVVGECSGPMHLACLCKTPVVSWSEPKKNTVRFRLWNPFKVDAVHLESYIPTVDEVLQEILKRLPRR
jgi:ADP-heptose:LPS heptosyltransferase